MTVLKEIYAKYTFDFAAGESGVEARILEGIAEDVANCGGKLAAHNWRSAASGNLGGWQVARCLWFLSVLTGSIGVEGGTSANAWDKWVPRPHKLAPHVKRWNELTWPGEYPLSYFEMSFLLPHFLKEGRGKLDVYFTRVYNPMWTNPDGFTWLEVLRDESKIGLHVALTPTWNETAWWADYVLPMGHGSERHDLMSQETHAGQWIAFRQPVRRVALERLGKRVDRTYEANPGQVWEETEFWVDLSWEIDPDGSLGIRQYFESPYRPGERITMDEYFGWMFENTVPGLPEAAAKEGSTPLAYMRKYGAFEIRTGADREFARALSPDEVAAAQVDETTGILYTNEPAAPPRNIVPTPAPVATELGRPVGVMIDGAAQFGFPTPSRKLEFYSPTVAEFGWPELAIPEYVRSHIHPDSVDRSANEFVLLSTYRLPTLIHTRSANAKWLVEISHSNPTWIHTSDAGRLGLANGDLVRVSTEIGYFVDKVWITEGIRPGVIACSHHLGRWRLAEGEGVSRAASALVELKENEGEWNLRQQKGVGPYKSADPDTSRIWWTDAGVHQNLTFPVQPDPVSGSHCWHQKVKVARAGPQDRYGDIHVDTRKSHEAFRRWLALTRAPKGEWRRPLWMLRPFRPDEEAYRRVGAVGVNVPSPSLGLLSRLWLREPDARVIAECREFPSLTLHADEPSVLATAYADLFLLNVYPYGTAFTDPSGELNGPAAAQAARHYEERGFRPPELFEVGAPDHVGLGLAYLEHLERRGEEDARFSSSFREWVPVACLAVEREPSAHPFYRAVAAATRDRVLDDALFCHSEEPPTPCHSEERSSARDASTEAEEEEIGLSHVVRFFLSPARSGLFLSRAKLGQLARTAGMRLPFGSRFDVAHLFFETAGESGNVATVLDLLETELAAWEAEYRGWASQHPRWAPAAVRWLARTVETRRRLGEMRGILENPPELEYVNEPR